MNRTNRAQRLRELRLAHDAWVEDHEQGASARFRPERHPKPGSDYNLHHVTYDADGAAQDEYAATAARILGLA